VWRPYGCDRAEQKAAQEKAGRVLLADLDVHPRVVMQILRHADFKVTMEIYTQVSSKQTRDALKRLIDRLGGS
jgi:integrase